jgi:hypothetical protein
LVYELLCGRTPYARADAGAMSWAKAVIEESPESFNRALSRTTGRTSDVTAAACAATPLEHAGTDNPRQADSARERRRSRRCVLSKSQHEFSNSRPEALKLLQHPAR